MNGNSNMVLLAEQMIMLEQAAEVMENGCSIIISKFAEGYGWQVRHDQGVLVESGEVNE